MIENNELLLDRLQQLLSQKKSKAFYAEKLGVTTEVIYELLKGLRKKGKNDTLNDPEEFEDEVVTKKVNVEKGTLESTRETTFDPQEVDELAKLHKIDLTRYKISSYWSKLKSNGKFTSSVFATLKKENSQELIQQEFIDFLKYYRPVNKRDIKIKINTENKEKISLLLPKQDAHFNKYSVDGKNDINDRFRKNLHSIWRMLKKASSVNFVEEIVYIIGSDQFNSEWTSLTTKGTPQSNILSYQESFEAICTHEIEVINDLLDHANNIKILYIPGNHDEYVGWHLINFLKVYFRGEKNIKFDDSILNTKYHRFGNTAIMFNHGDAIKPKDLAHRFPIGFKDEWSLCDNYVIITGDKHNELSLDISGIKFYQLPQLSPAISKWDDKQGYTTNKAEMTAFVITQDNGISDIYKEIL